LTGPAGVPPRRDTVAGLDVLHRVRVARRVVARGAPRGTRVHPADRQRQDEGHEACLPRLETRSVALGEGFPHVYLLVATALMPQNVPQLPPISGRNVGRRSETILPRKGEPIPWNEGF